MIVAERAFVAAHPQAIAAVLQATAEGLELYKADADRAIPVLATHLGMQDPELVRATWDYYRQAYSADLEPRGLEIILAEALRERPARAATRVEDLLDLRFVPGGWGRGSEDLTPPAPLPSEGRGSLRGRGRRSRRPNPQPPSLRGKGELAWAVSMLAVADGGGGRGGGAGGGDDVV